MGRDVARTTSTKASWAPETNAEEKQAADGDRLDSQGAKRKPSPTKFEPNQDVTPTDGARLDSQVAKRKPISTRSEPSQTVTLGAQQASLGAAFRPDATEADHDRAEAWFTEHDRYVDPETGRIYEAQFDPLTGELELTRTSDALDPADVVGGTDVRDDRDLDDNGRPLGRILQLSGGTGSSGSGTTGAEDGGSLSRDDKTGGAVTDARKSAAATTVDGGGASVGTMQETIVVEFDGDRSITRVFEVEGDGSLRVVQDFRQRHDGRIEGGTIARTSSIESEHGAETSSTVDTYGESGKLELRVRTTETSTPDAAVTGEVGTATFDGGIPTSVDEQLDYTVGDVVASERVTSEYEGGKRVRSTIAQDFVDASMTPPARGAAATMHVTWDDEGHTLWIGGDKQRGAAPTINDMLADVRHADGSSMVLSQVLIEPRRREGTDVPGYIARSGIAVNLEGVEVFQEGARPGSSGAERQQLEELNGFILETPFPLRRNLERVQLLDGANPGDAYMGNVYEIDGFVANASVETGSGSINVYNGVLGGGYGTFLHELGHVSGASGGASDEDEWAAAMEADAGVDDAFLDRGDVVGETDIAVDSLGITSYGDTALASGSENEDWAESVQLWNESRANGGLVTVVLANGTTVTATFEQLYPARTAILEEHYKSRTSPVPIDHRPVP